MKARVATLLAVIACAAALSARSQGFEFVDERPVAERQGVPYPKAPFKFRMHGDKPLDPDKSLQPDRATVLRERLAKSASDAVAGQRVRLERFYVLEGRMRDSFVRDASGKTVRNTAPAVPTLVAELMLWVGSSPYHGRAEVKLAGASATQAESDKVAELAIDAVLEDLLRSSSHGRR